MGQVTGDLCVFCEIAEDTTKASVVYEDDDVLAFMDYQPVTPGHLLVVPRAHAVGLADLDEMVGVRVWQVAHRLGRALCHADLRCEGVNMFLADGGAAFQEVFHFHLHVFPRFAGDSFRIDAEWRKRERGELDEAATAVRLGLSRLDDAQEARAERVQ
jgi:diadenosine tetraphosphate (Ap4A) HIT family hydrolase